MATSPPPAAQSRLDALPDDDNWAVEAARVLLAVAESIGCSDLHLLCRRSETLARGRRDGVLVPLAAVPLKWRAPLIARFKVLARLPAFIREEPQDGRIEWPRPDGVGPPALLRVSFLPTLHGESVVIRFPERDEGLLELESLGMAEEVRRGVEALLQRQEGAILLTGPSSSGKTTSLYAMLAHLNKTRGDRVNILTIEDPIERDLGFAGQVQINAPQDLTFARALRSALRHDPNALMIGEIRDEETARIAMQAGMTGHLVLSTLHAGRAARVFTRLLSMGVEPYLAASALSGAAAQRLARLLCPACRRPDPQSGGQAADGCEACAGTGRRGRTGLFELAVVTEELRELILARATPDQIARQASRSQAGDLIEAGRRLVESGRVARAEIDYVLAGEEAGA